MQTYLELDVGLFEERDFFGVLSLFHGPSLAFSLFNGLAFSLELKDLLVELAFLFLKVFDLIGRMRL